MLKRLTQLDYDRDMAFVALDRKTGALAGVGRLSGDPHRRVAEYALVVRTDLQGHGLGWALLQHIIGYARAEGIGRIEGIVLNENNSMLTMCREFGSRVEACQIVIKQPRIIRLADRETRRAAIDTNQCPIKAGL